MGTSGNDRTVSSFANHKYLIGFCILDYSGHKLPIATEFEVLKIVPYFSLALNFDGQIVRVPLDKRAKFLSFTHLQ